MKLHSITQLLAYALLATVSVSAQQIQFAVTSGPYYVGEPVVIQVILDRVDSKIELSCRLKGDPPAGLDVQGPQVGRSVRSFTQIINGRMSSHESMDYKFQFVATANKKGEYMVGPFEVIANGKPQEVAGGMFRFGELESDPDMQITVSIPQQAVYIGQEVPATIRWSFAGNLDEVRYAFSNLQIRSPLFDQFSFRDVRPTTRTTLSIATAKGSIEIDAEVTQEKVAGRDFIVVTGTRIMIPDAPGQFLDIPVTCRTQKVLSWRRDFFGDAVPGQRAPALAAGEPIDIVVKPIPQSGRPASFAGAVGRGFSIDVSANRSVVRVGDPISLNVTVRGDGNVANISLPPLDASDGLSGDRFQIPHDTATGTIDGDAKQFNVNVRVRDPEVSQIPAIAFSWFDPYQEQFSTAHSKPIALQVMETQVVSADDVISSAPAGSSQGNRQGTGDVEPSSSNAMSFVGANLAIARDPAQLLANGALVAAPSTIAAGCYVLAGVLVMGSVLLRRRAGRDPEVLWKRKRLKHLLGQVEKAKSMPTKEASEAISRVLRDLISETALRDRTEIDQLVAQCDNISYTTGSVDDGDFAQIVSAAERLVRQATKR